MIAATKTEDMPILVNKTLKVLLSNFDCREGEKKLFAAQSKYQ